MRGRSSESRSCRGVVRAIPRATPRFRFSCLALLLCSAFALCQAEEGWPLEPRVSEFDRDAPALLMATNSAFELQQVEPSELIGTGGRTAISSGMGRVGGNLLDMPRIRTRIVRSLPGVWRLRVDERADVRLPHVRYSLVSPSGQVGRLGLLEDSRFDLPARLLPQQSTVIARTDSGKILEGGVDLVIDLDRLETAGTYSGTLTVTVEWF